MVNHNNTINLNGTNIKISKTTLSDLLKMRKNKEEFLTIDELFDYIKQNRAKFFFEVKTSSPFLVRSIAEKIKEYNLWEKIEIIGFSFIIKNALKAQLEYPKLQVGQILHFPLSSYIRMPRKSYSVFLGWLDGTPGSQRLFKTLISSNSLFKLRKRLEKKGFKVMGGVINNDKGLKLFKEAGINDIVTDRVSETVKFFKSED